LFQHSIFSKARALQKTIVLPEGDDVRVVEAASILTTRKLCKVQLVGTPGVIKRHASKVRGGRGGGEVKRGGALHTIYH
jgi:phosphate acetyltransferase